MKHVDYRTNGFHDFLHMSALDFIRKMEKSWNIGSFGYPDLMWNYWYCQNIHDFGVHLVV